jgi:hypothetical protein
MIDAIADYLRRHGLERVTDLIGSVQMGKD